MYVNWCLSHFANTRMMLLYSCLWVFTDRSPPLGFSHSLLRLPLTRLCAHLIQSTAGNIVSTVWRCSLFNVQTLKADRSGFVDTDKDKVFLNATDSWSGGNIHKVVILNIGELGSFLYLFNFVMYLTHLDWMYFQCVCKFYLLCKPSIFNIPANHFGIHDIYHFRFSYVYFLLLQTSLGACLSCSVYQFEVQVCINVCQWHIILML